MLTALRQFYRRNFCPLAKAELWDLFDRNPGLCKALILVEIAPLAGIRTTYAWEEFREIGRFVIREFHHKTRTRKTIAERDVERNEVTEVIRRVREAYASIGNYSGGAKDGVYYYFCWGCPSEMSLFSIENPQVGSKPHQDFVEMIKGFCRR